MLVRQAENNGVESRIRSKEIESVRKMVRFSNLASDRTKRESPPRRRITQRRPEAGSGTKHWREDDKWTTNGKSREKEKREMSRQPQLSNLASDQTKRERTPRRRITQRRPDAESEANVFQMGRGRTPLSHCA